MSQKRLMYLMGTGCILLALFGSGLLQHLVGSGSGSAVVVDVFGLACGGVALFFILRGRSLSVASAAVAEPKRSKANRLYTILGAALAVLLTLAILYLTGSH